MHIHLSTSDGVPIYLQIVTQVKYLVASGRLAPGEELPPIRVLAEKLVINPNTVVRAYKELERAGVVVKRGTIGTFVADAACQLPRQEYLPLLAGRIDALLAEARTLNLDFEELLELIRQRHQALNSSSSTSTSS